MPRHTPAERNKRRVEEERARNKKLQEEKSRRIREASEARANAPKRTPSSAGTLNIQDRERLAAARAQDQGIAPQGSIKRQETLQEIQVAKQIKSQQTAGQTLEEAGAFEEVTPREVSLAPEERPGGGIPILGPSVSAIQGAIGSIVQDTIFAGEAVVTGEQAFPIPMTPETVREAALREIKQKSFDEGISLSEGIGSVIESIPVVGSLANKYASGLTQTPSANTQTVLAEINRIKEAASTGQEKVRNGLEDPDFGLDRARSMEEDVSKLEGRIKLLINTSAQLRANTDNVNLIQEQILEAREKISRYRTASEFGLTAQLTGTGRIIPTDEALFFELKGGSS